MKKLMSLLIACSLVFTMFSCYISAGEETASTGEYLWEDRVNMKPAHEEDVFPFQNEYLTFGRWSARIGEGDQYYVKPCQEMGTTKSFNLIAPEGGATLLFFLEFDCREYPYVRQLFSDLTTAGWLDDPRLNIMAVNIGGENSGDYDTFIEKYCGSYQSSIDWYIDDGSWVSWWNKYLKTTIGGLGRSPFCAILQNEGTAKQEYGSCDVPALTLKYLDYHVTRSMLENTLEYMFPGIVAENEIFTPPENELWEISFMGNRHNDAVYDVYDQVMTLRWDTDWGEDMSLVLDSHLTQVAMQRAKEIAISYEHTRPNGTTPTNCALEMGYLTDYDLGENIGVTAGEVEGQSHADRMMASWYESEGHRQNMVNYLWKKIGIGCYEIEGTYYWVQLFDFARPTGNETTFSQTGTVREKATVETKTSHLHLQVRNSIYLDQGDTTPYRVIQVSAPPTYGMDSPPVPLIFSQFDSSVKGESGQKIAAVEPNGDHNTLNITYNALGIGNMTYKISPDQKETVTVIFHGKEPHTQHDYFYGGCFFHSDCYTQGYDRYFCACGAYWEGNYKPIEHIDQLVQVGKEPTCTKTGLTEGLYCLYCKTQLIPQEEIPMLPHKEVVYKEGYAATCTKTGLTDTLQCTECGYLTTLPTTIPKLDHKEIYVPAVPATCKQQGKTEGKICEHCGKVYEGCQLIGYGGHVMVTLPAKEPTCTKSGLTEGYGCSECGYVKTAQEKVAAKGHTIVTVPGKAATCLAPGYTASYVCEDCGEVRGEATVIPQLMHNYVAVEGDTRKKCTRCGCFEGEEPPEISEPDPTPPDDPVTSTDVLEAGDINGDEIINAKDALVALKVAVGKAKLTEAQKAAADVNKDGQINAKDALEILKHSVGKPSVLSK